MTGHVSTGDRGKVQLRQEESVAWLVLSRSVARNALTWEMYDQLEIHLERLAENRSAKVVVVCGNGQDFSAGTDIRQFDGFGAVEGRAYEKRIDALMTRLAGLPQPTIAAVQGIAVGGGLLIAAHCDLRYATPDARFGAPMARTLGNCLSIANYHRLVGELGPTRVTELLLTARLLSAREAHEIGFLARVFDADGFHDEITAIATQIAENAPLSLWATKEARKRLDRMPLPSYDDVLGVVYGSRDFSEGVESHREKRRPKWQGR
ncbi:MAG: enoyl-CoA hydratase [Trueperaceae bacterium]